MIDEPEWHVLPGLSDYSRTLDAMSDRATAIRAGTASEAIWLVEHPPLYTAGTSADVRELLSPQRFPVFEAGRGGRYTYHGPGQRVVYTMMDLARRGRDVRRFVTALESWVLDTLRDFGVEGQIVEGKVGVWVLTPAGIAKIAALGIRVRQWVSFHGLSINVGPDLSHFSGIIPCGLPEPVTSLSALGINVSLLDVDSSLRRHLPTMLASVECAPAKTGTWPV